MKRFFNLIFWTAVALVIGVVGASYLQAQSVPDGVPPDLAEKPIKDWFTQLNILTLVVVGRLAGELIGALRNQGGLVGIFRAVVFGQSVPKAIAVDYKQELAPKEGGGIRALFVAVVLLLPAWGPPLVVGTGAVILTTACASRTAYKKSLLVTGESVRAAMNIYGGLHRAGVLTAAEEERIDFLHDRQFLPAYNAAVAAANQDLGQMTPAKIGSLAADLIDLITQLRRQHPEVTLPHEN